MKLVLRFRWDVDGYAFSIGPHHGIIVNLAEVCFVSLFRCGHIDSWRFGKDSGGGSSVLQFKSSNRLVQVGCHRVMLFLDVRSRLVCS
jgi:hypothetical protein